MKNLIARNMLPYALGVLTGLVVPLLEDRHRAKKRREKYRIEEHVYLIRE